MNYRQAKIVLRTSIILIVLLCGFGVYRCTRGDVSTTDPETQTPSTSVSTDVKQVAKSTVNQVRNAISPRRLKISPKVYNHARQFNDLNDEHLIYAKKVGISPIESTRQIMNITRPIVKLSTCDDYVIDNLKHSYPYLVEPAALLLHDIGAEFNRKLAEQGGGDYKIKVTSVLRTAESVSRLKRRNVNSTENSAHLYGTTFDISYVDFKEGNLNMRKHTDGDLKNLLAEVLLEMKENGRCLIKFERKQGCFHITSTGK